MVVVTNLTTCPNVQTSLSLYILHLKLHGPPRNSPLRTVRQPFSLLRSHHVNNGFPKNFVEEILVRLYLLNFRNLRFVTDLKWKVYIKSKNFLICFGVLYILFQVSYLRLKGNYE